ncbi:MAG: hypothetical protein K0B11_02775 [Mariniphaga sp.]|nr:hypothetical protein [Mariniphaga sp.]
MKWLEDNSNQFLFPPELKVEKRELLMYEFNRLIPELKLSISERNIDIFVEYPVGECFDILFNWEVDLKTTSDGKVYCTICKSPRKYDNQFDLYSDHSFIPLLNWVNKITKDSYLLLSEYSKDGVITARCAEIITNKKRRVNLFLKTI